MEQEIKQIAELMSKMSKEDQKKLIKQINNFIGAEKLNPTTLKVLECKRNIENKNGLKCPYCGENDIVGYGNYNGRSRYKCKSCQRTFNELTGTPMAGSHYLGKWEKYLQHMIEGRSLRYIARELDIAVMTAFFWRHKILNAFERVGCDKLEGIVETDETFFLYSEKGNKHIYGRLPRKRGGKANKRGVSKEQVAVLASCDRMNHSVVGIACFGRISKDDVERVIGDYIDEDNIFCSDAHRSYTTFTKSHNIKHEPVNLSKGERIRDKIYHIQNVNSYHSRLKRWMGRFNGVSTKYLSYYLSWFRILDKTKEQVNRTKDFLNNSLLIPRIVTVNDVKSSNQQCFYT